MSVITTVHTQVSDVLKTTESYVVDSVEKANKPVQDAVSNLPFADSLGNLPTITDIVKKSFELARAGVDMGFGLAEGFLPGTNDAPAATPAPKATTAKAAS